MLNTRLTGLCLALGTAATLAFGGWDNSLKLLLSLMTTDYITGIIVALVFKNSPKSVNGCLSSKAGFKGICRKAVMLLVVLIAYRLQVATGIDYIREATVYGFCVNELISLTENAGLMGVPLPTAIKKAVEILKETEDMKKQ